MRFLTNFDPRQRPIYEEAIHRYSGPGKFHIGDADAVIPGDLSLYTDIPYPGDTGDFWRVFEEVQRGWQG